MFDPNKLFQVTIKGLVFDGQGRVLLCKDDNGRWDLPGGRMEHGEDVLETIQREINEEIGVGVELLKNEPKWLWTALDNDNNWRLVVCFEVKLSSNEFKVTDENVKNGYFSKNDLDSIVISSQIEKIKRYL